MGLNNLYKTLGISVPGFILNCTKKNKELKWSKKHPAKKKRVQNTTLKKKEKKTQIGSEMKKKKKDHFKKTKNFIFP